MGKTTHTETHVVKGDTIHDVLAVSVTINISNGQIVSVDKQQV
jgi:hypothetical protein